MANLFKVHIESVPVTAKKSVTVVLKEMLGPDAANKIEQLLNNGGLAFGNLNDQAANVFASKLRDAGATVSVEPSNSTLDLFRVCLLSFGTQKLQVVKQVKNITGLGLQDAKKMVEDLGVVLEKVTVEVAQKAKIKLESAGATVSLEPLGEKKAVDGFIVFGKVTEANGEPLSGLLVRAFDRDLRSKELLGEATTKTDGSYQIEYSSDDFKKAEKNHADLTIKVFNEVDTPLQATSERKEIIFNAKQEEEINLIVQETEPVRASEFERLVAMLNPLLDGATFASLTVKEIDFLVLESEILEFGEEFPDVTNSIHFISQSAKLSRETNMPGEAFYGWARKKFGLVPDEDTDQLTLNLNTLLEKPDDELNATLVLAIEGTVDPTTGKKVGGNIIPVWSAEQFDSILAQVQNLRDEKAQEERKSWIQHQAKGILIDAVSAEPLDGYFVRAETSNQNSALNLEGSITNTNGEFIITYALPPASTMATLSLVLNIEAPNGETLDEQEVSITVDQVQPVTLKITVPVPVVPGEDVLLEALPMSFSSDLSTVLETNNLSNIAALRKVGNLDNLVGLPESLQGSDELKELQAHVDLSLLSTDLEPEKRIKQNQFLIDNGYNSYFDIADTTLEHFTEVLGGDASNIIHPDLVYRNATRINHLIGGLFIDLQKGATKVEDNEDMPDPALSCTCEDCVSAISPGAYLTDLIGYVTKKENVPQANGDAITLDFLVENFHQPLSKLPINCAATKTQVRQVRIACEVLYSALSTNDLKASENNEGVKQYRKKAYQALLRNIGTSSAVLQRASSTKEIESIANRIGITPENVQALQDQDNAFNHVLAEETLEGLFGLPAFVEQANAKLLDPLRYLNSEQTPPLLYDWKLERLQNQWKAMDFPKSPLAENTPIIDPDVIGPDDFRNPDAANTAFTLWKARREWVDVQVARIHGKVTSESHKPNGLKTAISEIPVQTTLNNLIAQQAKLTDNAKVIKDDKFSKWLTERHLSVEALTALAKFATDVKANKEYNDEEWKTYTTTATNILVNSVKRAAYKDWISEEGRGNVSLDNTTFWPSLTEPKEGEWSLFLEDKKPLIDPEKIEPKDLPDEKFGSKARKFWSERRKKLNEKQKEYTDILKSKSADRLSRIMIDAFGSAPDIKAINTKLNSLDQTEQADAKAQLSVLNIDEESFRSLVSASLILEDINQVVSDTILNKLSAALVTAHKLNFFYDDWITDDEKSPYWKLLKARLPKWRASQQQRQQWQQALQQSSKPPLIDPDIISGDVLLEPVIGNFAFTTWRTRTKLIDAELKVIRDKIEKDGNVSTEGVIKPDAASDLFSEDKYLGISLKALIALSKLEEEGISISSRLLQISLARDAYLLLLDVAKRIEKGSKVLLGTRENMYAILLQIWKIKQFSTWRAEEKNELSLSPEFFKHPKQRPLFTTQQDAQKWRVDTRWQREWYRTLKGRIEQQETLVSSLKTVVSDVEEQTLPALRNALIEIVEKSNDEPHIKAEKLTKRFLIGMQLSGCQMTTRVGMALEVLQTLVFSIRSGNLDIAGVELQLNSKQFEKEWKWMGSYATWKSAMGVFLYPEQVLYPSLRKDKTSGFKALSKDINNLTNFSQKDACKVSSQYFDYLDDVRNIVAEASCYANTKIVNSDECHSSTPRISRNLFHIFGKGSNFNGVYVSTLDWESIKQTSWIPLLFTKNTKTVVGAVPYGGYLLLFTIVLAEKKETLFLTRQNLDSGDWSESQELVLPGDPRFVSVAIVEQLDNSVPPILVINYRKEDTKHSLEDLYDHFTLMKQVNSDGTDWDESGLLRWTTNELRPNPSSGVGWEFPYYVFYNLYVKAAIETEDAFYVFSTNSKNTVTYIKVIGKRRNSRDDSRTLLYVFYKGMDSAFTYGSSNDVYVINNGDVFLVNIFDSFSNEIIRKFGNTKTTTDAELRMYQHVYYISHKLLNGFIFPYGRLAVHSGGFPDRKMLRVASTDHDYNPWGIVYSKGSLLVELRSETIDGNRFISTGNFLRVTPLISDSYGNFIDGPSAISSFRKFPNYSDLDRLGHRVSSSYFLNENKKHNTSLLPYIEEAYYFVPLVIAISLAKSGNYKNALLWFRLILDYTGLPFSKEDYNRYALKFDNKLVYEGLQDDEINGVSIGDIGWLIDPINPHEIASQRSGTYKRFTVQSIVRCLLGYADSEFTLDTSESVPRAKSLYQAALDLIQSELPVKATNKCHVQIETETRKYIVKDITLQPYYKYIKLKLGEISATDALEITLEKVLSKLKANGLEEKRLSNALEVIQVALGERKEPLTVIEILTKSLQTRNKFSQATLKLLSPFNLFNLGSFLPSLANFNPNATGTNHTEIETVTSDFNKIKIAYTPRLSYEFCIPNNPTAKFLLLRAELNLFKIRNCMNIAGMKRELEPFAASIDIESALPSMGAGGQLNLAGVTRIRPTLYRYPVLVDRAKQLANLAQQTEVSFFSAWQSRDQEAYSLFKARQDVALSREGVKLQKLRVRESEGGVGFAELQLERTSILAETYGTWFNNGMLDQENALLEKYDELELSQQAGVAARGLTAIANMAMAVSIADWTNKISVGVSGTMQVVSAVLEGAAQSWAFSVQNSISTLSLELSFELRNREYELQHILAGQDLVIGNQQIKLANDRVYITEQEQVIAEIQSEQASDTVTFLQEKFTNVELYDWMSGVLENIFRYYLQQASSMSKLAEIQLAFERQEPLIGVIKDDYYELPNNDVNDSASSNSSSVDRRGLTGSARLLRDITKLDQYAFTTDQRKQQLSVNISLSQLDPFAFQQFKKSGVLNFDTSGKLFDRRFPGQYLRLIKRVRISVIALVPPVHGISATLTSSGISRATIAGDVFQTAVIRRDPESIVFTNPIGASGVFELNPNPEMLLPFEGNGVDTRWEFRMPEAANPMDFSTVADILLTIEYTALHDFNYQQQVQGELDPYVSADRAYSFRQQFADAWYDLNNPDQTNAPMRVTFNTRRGDFPPNLKDVSISEVLLYFVTDEELPRTLWAELTLTQDGESLGGKAAPNDGVISTRTNGNNWFPFKDRDPEGEWEFSLPNNQQIKNLFTEEKIKDILLVITYSGQNPGWPE